MSVSPAITTSVEMHYLPGIVTANRISHLDDQYKYLRVIDSYWFLVERLLKEPKYASKKKLLLDSKKKLIELREEGYSSIMDQHFNGSDSDITLNFIGLDNECQVIEGTKTFEKPLYDRSKDPFDSDLHVTVSWRTSRYPIGKGTDWVLTLSSQKEYLQTAMLSTTTKEELLVLLCKIGIIKEGEWLTPQEYFAKNDIKKCMLAKKNDINGFISKEVFPYSLTEDKK